MTAPLSERIAEVEAKLAAIRSRRGEAVLDGDDSFDVAEYTATQAQLDALRDAEGIAVHRERAAAQVSRGRRRAELKDIVTATERERIEAITEADEHARALVEALQRAAAANDRIHKAIHELTGKGAHGFQPLNFENRLSGYLAAVMRSFRDGPRGGRFGFINWPAGPRRKSGAWAIEEDKIVAGDLKQALK